MGSPFKMKPKTPMMKALVGKQGNLPQHLQDKIKAAPESPAKSYGSKTKSPVMQKDTKGKKKFGEADAETRERQSIGQRDVQRGSGGQRKGKIGGVRVKAKVGKERGATDLLEVAKDTYKAGKKYVKSKLGISKMEDNSPVKKKKMSQKAAERKQRKGKGFISRKIGGKSQDATFTKFTRKGRKQLKETGKVSSDNMKLNKSTPIKKNGRPKVKTLGEKEFISERRGAGFAEDTSKTNIQKAAAQRTVKNTQRQALKTSAKKGLKELKKRTPIKKKGVKALEAQRGTKNPSPIKKHGSKKSPVMQQKLKKKDTKGKTKLPKLVVNTPKGPKAPRGPQKGTIRGVHVSIQTKGRSTKNTDLLPYLKGRGKGSGARARKRSRS